MWATVDIAFHTIITKTSNCDTRDFSLDARIPSMYYQAQPEGFQNTRIYIPPDMYSTYNSGTSNTKKTGIVIPVSFVIHVAFICSDFCNQKNLSFQTTRKVHRSEDQATTAETSPTAAATPASTAANNTTQQSNNVSEQKSSVSDDDVIDEITEPPTKRLRTRSSAAASSHQ